MHPAFRFFALTMALVGCLAFADDSAAQTKKTSKSPKKTSGSTVKNKAHVKSQIRRRTPGQRVFVVQARRGGWGKTGLMTPAAAVVTRTRLRSKGFSAHIHNHGTQGALVHYNQGQWRSQAMFANRQAASQAVAVLRANGMQTRIVTR